MKGRRPNILIFMPDQLRADALGCFGSPVARTPNIDALAARGTRFTNAWVNHPVCSPSRVSMMTGWYPHVRGHRTLTHLVQPHEPNLLAQLRAADYYVAFAGARGDVFAPGVTEHSTDFCGWTVRPEREQMTTGPTHPEGSPKYHAFLHGMRPDVPGGVWLDFDEAVTRTALDFLEAPPSEPWLLWMPMLFPHLPFEVERDWYEAFDPAAMPAPIPPQPGKAPFQAEIHRRAHLDALELGDWQEIARIYHAMTARIDAQLGRVLASLEQSGQLDDTLVVFLTDHGEYLGDFGLVEKWPAGLEPCLTRNPMIVAGAGTRARGVRRTGRDDRSAADAPGARRHRSCAHALRPFDAALPRGCERQPGAHRDLRRGRLPHRRCAPVRGVGRRVRTQVVPTARTTGARRQVRGHARVDLDLRPSPGCAVGALRSPVGPGRNDEPVGRRKLTSVHSEQAQRMRGAMLDWLLETSDVIPLAADPRFPRVPHGFRDESA